MEKITLDNGYVKLTYANGVRDKRNGNVYKEAVCKESNIKYYEDNE